MGNFFATNMQDNFKKNQERQLQLQYEMQKRQMAMQISRTRDLCQWLTTFYVISAAGLVTGFIRTKRPALLSPLFPLTFVTLYQWDAAYGTKLERMRTEAEHIMNHEVDILQLPCGLPSASQVESGHIDDEEKKKIQPPLPAN